MTTKTTRNEKGQFATKTRKEWFAENAVGLDFPVVTENIQNAEKRLNEMLETEKKILKLMVVATRNGTERTENKSNYHFCIYSTGDYSFSYQVTSRQELENLMIERIKKQAEFAAIADSPII